MQMRDLVGWLMRRPRVRIVNFISAFPNIGNYTPVWGIWKMLPGLRPKTQIDCRKFKRVNAADYDLALVGGAGLLNVSFEPFWEWIAQQRLPVLIWGVGGCWPTPETPWRRTHTREGFVKPSILKGMKSQIIAANVRDELTRDLYELDDADISFCPTAEYFKKDRALSRAGSEILYAHHDELYSDAERDEIVRACSSYTSNVALNGETFRSILRKYRRADVIVTSRLHGAIIANSLGRPYVALIRDRKFEAFHATYGHGVECTQFSELPARIDTARKLPHTRRIDYEAVEAFGAKARAIIAGMAR